MTAVCGTRSRVGHDGTHSLELWKSDGTAAGTVLVKDINPSTAFGGGSSPFELTAVGGTLYFTAFDGVGGINIALWKRDGTAAGTVMDAAINPGPARSDPRNLAFVNGSLFFSADDGQNGREPWILTPDPPGAPPPPGPTPPSGVAAVASSPGAPEEGSRPQTATGVPEPDRSRR